MALNEGGAGSAALFLSLRQVIFHSHLCKEGWWCSLMHLPFMALISLVLVPLPKILMVICLVQSNVFLIWLSP